MTDLQIINEIKRGINVDNHLRELCKRHPGLSELHDFDISLDDPQDIAYDVYRLIYYQG